MINFAFHRIQHIGIPVTDIKTSEAFYNKLGFENVMTSQFDFNGDKGNVIMTQKEEMIIEIYQMPEKELIGIRSRKAGNIDHVAFDVSDIDTAFAELKKEGFHIIEEAPVSCRSGKTAVSILIFSDLTTNGSSSTRFYETEMNEIISNHHRLIKSVFNFSVYLKRNKKKNPASLS